MENSARCPRCGAPSSGVGEACPKCRDTAAAPELDALRARFPQLEVQEVLGRGGMGVVYRARHRQLDRALALKVLDPALAAQPGFAARFAREARALARLDHPNIVAVHDVGEIDGTFFLSMELVDGGNLRALLRSGTLTPARALALAPQICAGLQYAHEHGVVHRDVKPENILVDRSGRVKIADFGLAKLVDRAGPEEALTRASQAMGTPEYMAPEQMRHAADVDHRADIYSLGVVLYELLTGGLPVGNFRLPSDCAPVGTRVDELVLKALEPEPARRFQRISEVSSELEGCGTAASSAPAGGLEAFPGGAPALVILAFAISWAWMLAIRLGTALPLVWSALAYPFAFVAFLAARTLPRPARRPASAACLVTAGVAAGFSSTELDLPALALGLSILAIALLLAAHLLFDRWIRSGAWALLAAATAPFLAATVLHSALTSNPGRAAYYFASGMSALLAASSLAALLPSMAASEPGPRSGPALVRALVVGATGAAFYFHRQIF